MVSVFRPMGGTPECAKQPCGCGGTRQQTCFDSRASIHERTLFPNKARNAQQTDGLVFSGIYLEPSDQLFSSWGKMTGQQRPRCRPKNARLGHEVGVDYTVLGFQWHHIYRAQATQAPRGDLLAVKKYMTLYRAGYSVPRGTWPAFSPCYSRVCAAVFAWPTKLQAVPRFHSLFPALLLYLPNPRIQYRVVGNIEAHPWVARSNGHMH